MRITLIGFMGCGKTTVGNVLAERMGYEFLDLDKVIETTANHSISGIFKTHGEDEFRKLEQEALKVALAKDNCVIATGGGTPCFFDNMEMINKGSISVYLKMSIDSLFERLETEQSQRPLIGNFNDKELKKFISEMLVKREPYYNKAHYKVKAKNIQIGALADFIRQECLSTTNAHIK